MNSSLQPPATMTPEGTLKGILAWLHLTHKRRGSAISAQLLQQASRLREASVSLEQRIQMLCLLFAQAERLANFEIYRAQHITLPLGKQTRKRLRLQQTILANLAEDFSLIADSASLSAEQRQTVLHDAILATALQLQLSHLAASVSSNPLWQQLHSLYARAQRAQLASHRHPRHERSIQHIYMDAILLGIAQPASFTSEELAFIRTYIRLALPSPELSATTPHAPESAFWIDANSNHAAIALSRRPPSPDQKTLFFSCQELAQTVEQHLLRLRNGEPPEALSLPGLYGTDRLPDTLEHLAQAWGRPAKRRFSRRRQSYRVHLHTQADMLLHRLASPSAEGTDNDWMVVNESPDGYAIMHINGPHQTLRVGDVVALEIPAREVNEHQRHHICQIRWAVSENPEHLELGLQILAPNASVVTLRTSNKESAAGVPALLLPESPPIRHLPALLVKQASLPAGTRQITVDNPPLPSRRLELQTPALRGGQFDIFNAVAIQ